MRVCQPHAARSDVCALANARALACAHNQRHGPCARAALLGRRAHEEAQLELAPAPASFVVTDARISTTVPSSIGFGDPTVAVAGTTSLLGNQVGGGTGRKLATVAGAVGGAYAGKKIQGKMQTHKVWGVSVEFPDGSRGHFEFDQDPGLKVGDAVRKSGNSIAR